MKYAIKQTVVLIFLWVCAAMPPSALAETGGATGLPDTEISARARLKLRVIIPRFLQFQVGSAGTTVDTITFEPASDAVGNGTPVVGTGSDAGGGSGTNVEVRSNAGQIAIVADNDGGSGGLGNSGSISLTEITASSDSSDLQTPQLTDAGGTSTKVSLTGGNVTDRRATWSYVYDNHRAVEPGSYEAEIVYTAVSP
jgi:hypothetical protein